MSDYNGWKNYETWACHLWLSNDEGTWNYWTEIARDEVEDNPSEALYNLEDRLKAEFEEQMPELPASFWSDILQAALSDVDWREVAEALIESVTVS